MTDTPTLIAILTEALNARDAAYAELQASISQQIQDAVQAANQTTTEAAALHEQEKAGLLAQIEALRADNAETMQLRQQILTLTERVQELTNTLNNIEAAAGNATP